MTSFRTTICGWYTKGWTAIALIPAVITLAALGLILGRFPWERSPHEKMEEEAGSFGDWWEQHNDSLDLS